LKVHKRRTSPVFSNEQPERTGLWWPSHLSEFGDTRTRREKLGRAKRWLIEVDRRAGDPVIAPHFPMTVTENLEALHTDVRHFRLPQLSNYHFGIMVEMTR
jgi:hypothetical protein